MASEFNHPVPFGVGHLQLLDEVVDAHVDGGDGEDGEDAAEAHVEHEGDRVEVLADVLDDDGLEGAAQRAAQRHEHADVVTVAVRHRTPRLGLQLGNILCSNRILRSLNPLSAFMCKVLRLST